MLDPSNVMIVDPTRLDDIEDMKRITLKRCETCGEDIYINEPSVTHRYFGSRHVKCLDRALKDTRDELIAIETEIKELEK